METTNELNIRLSVNRNTMFLLLVGFFLCWHPGYIGSESLTLTTYYPAPYGGYVALLTTGTGGINTVLARDGGRVGIGTANPIDQLHVRSDTNQLFLDSKNGSWSQVDFGSGATSRAYVGYNNGSNYMTLGTTNGGQVIINAPGSQMYLRTASGSAGTGLSVDGSQRVGVGMEAPTRRLDVNGDVKIGFSGAAGTGSLFGLCHIQSFGGGWSSCTSGIVTAIYGSGCPAGGLLLATNSGDMMSAGNWVQHEAQNCSGQMLCCRIVAGN